MATTTCANCGKTYTKDQLPLDALAMAELVENKLRLFEEIAEYRYESFHLANKVNTFYCNKECAMSRMHGLLETFFSELNPQGSGSRGEKILGG